MLLILIYQDKAMFKKLSKCQKQDTIDFQTVNDSSFQSHWSTVKKKFIRKSLKQAIAVQFVW